MKKPSLLSLIIVFGLISGLFAAYPGSIVLGGFGGQNDESEPVINSLSSTPNATLTLSLTPTAEPSGTPAIPIPASPESTDTSDQFYEAQIIGTSVEGRSIWVYRFGNGSTAVMMVAGVHGGYEWNTVQLMDQIIARLKRYPELVPEDKTLYILRVFNIDGYVRDKGDDGRLNANGVDLNRNWKANWKASWEGTECWSRRVVSAGSKPFSEPESQALRDFIL